MPLVFAAFFRSVTSAWFTRNQDWTFRPKLEAIQEIFAEARWSLGGTAASALLRRSDYVVLGLLTPTRFVGVYFFAYQLAFVTVSFIWQALSKVLIPSFGRVADNPRVREGALIGGVQVVSLFATPAAIMLGLIIEPLEELLWNGRWTAAVTPIQIFSLFAATEMCLIVIQMVIQSMGAFRLWTVQVAMRGCGLAAAVAIAALISDTSISIVATIVVGYLIASACLQAYLLLNAIEIGMGEFVRAAGSGLAVNLACALAAALTTRQLVSSAPPLVQIGALLATYLIVFVILIRALAKRPWFHDFPSSHNIPIATTVIARLGLTSRR